MYPPSNNNCNNSIFSSLLHNIPSPSIQYDHELYFQYYHDNYLQQDVIEDFDILADTVMATSQLNCTDSEKILYNKETSTTSHRPEENEQEREGEIQDENKGAGEISSITSICKRTMSKNKTRCSKKDRHSKINTVRGPRDRRMRLSLDAARKFFKLQDMLGFDKASKTIEWLLVKSKSEIEELVKGIGGGSVPQMNKQRCASAEITGAISSTTSSSDGSKVADNIAIASDEFSCNDKKTKGPSSNKEKKARTARRVAFHLLTRESRNKARTKARERTKLKRSLGKSKLCYEAMAHDLNILGSNWRPSMNCEKPVAVEVEHHSTSNDSSLGVNGIWNQFTIFNYQQNSGIFHEHQLTDLQFCGKLWEA